MPLHPAALAEQELRLRLDACPKAEVGRNRIPNLDQTGAGGNSLLRNARGSDRSWVVLVECFLEVTEAGRRRACDRMEKLYIP